MAGQGQRKRECAGDQPGPERRLRPHPSEGCGPRAAGFSKRVEDLGAAVAPLWSVDEIVAPLGAWGYFLAGSSATGSQQHFSMAFPVWEQ